MTNMKMKRFFPLLLCALLLLCACSQNAGGGEEEALRSQIAALESQNEGKDKALAENASLLSELAQEKESLAAEIERLQEEKIRLEETVDELKNGAASQLVLIRNAMEQEKYQEVLRLAAALHSAYNGSAEDEAGMALAKQADEILARLEEERLAAERAAEEEKKKSEQQRAKETLRIRKLTTSKPNSAGGVDLDIDFVNKSEKTIKYIYFTVRPYNAVGDAVRCDIRDYSAFKAQHTGPVEPGETVSNIYWDCAWYNNSIKTAALEKVEIQYMDGTSLSFTGDAVSGFFY